MKHVDIRTIQMELLWKCAITTCSIFFSQSDSGHLLYDKLIPGLASRKLSHFPAQADHWSLIFESGRSWSSQDDGTSRRLTSSRASGRVDSSASCRDRCHDKTPAEKIAIARPPRPEPRPRSLSAPRRQVTPRGCRKTAPSRRKMALWRRPPALPRHARGPARLIEMGTSRESRFTPIIRANYTGCGSHSRKSFSQGICIVLGHPSSAASLRLSIYLLQCIFSHSICSTPLCCRRPDWRPRSDRALMLVLEVSRW